VALVERILLVPVLLSWQIGGQISVGRPWSVDHLSEAARSANMARVRARNTQPELSVRRALHEMGLRFRLHRTNLPGTPDIVLPRHKLVIFVHGCFWHRHEGCSRATHPKTRESFWRSKFAATVDRDVRQRTALEIEGWKVLTIWECEAKKPERIRDAVLVALREK
jgi:DNA mismatch endonuclease (patch repair protein)